MDYTCKNCGNVFGEHLAVCPSCGTPVEAVPQTENTASTEPEVQAQQQPYQEQPYQEQAYQQQTYQQQSYQQQPYQQQPYQQQTYQQQTYQQQSYQQQPYQQQPYQQQPYQQQSYQQPYQQTGYQPPVYTPNVGGEAKSKIAAGLLGIFLGCLGVHNFYLGFTGKAIAQLLISVLSCGALAVVSAIWGLIEGILILVGNISTDARGIPLTD